MLKTFVAKESGTCCIAILLCKKKYKKNYVKCDQKLQGKLWNKFFAQSLAYPHTLFLINSANNHSM